MNLDTFIKTINKLRLVNKNNWYLWSGIVNGHEVQIKGFGTWLQIYRVDGLNYSGLMDISVSQFKSTLEYPFTN